MGNGVGGQMAVYLNTEKGFQRSEAPALKETLVRDQTTILGFTRPDGTRALLAGSANYEDGQPRGSLAIEYPQDGAGSRAGRAARGRAGLACR